MNAHTPGPWDQTPATAVLIAAAPALYAALKNIAHYEARYADSVAYRIAFAALRQAEGDLCACVATSPPTAATVPAVTAAGRRYHPRLARSAG